MRVLISDLYNFAWWLVQLGCWLTGVYYAFALFGIVGVIIGVFIIEFVISVATALIKSITDVMMEFIFRSPRGSFGSRNGLIQAYQNTGDVAYLQMLDARLGKDLKPSKDKAPSEKDAA